jgi:hypothetical protein
MEIQLHVFLTFGVLPGKQPPEYVIQEAEWDPQQLWKRISCLSR